MVRYDGDSFVSFCKLYCMHEESTCHPVFSMINIIKHIMGLEDLTYIMMKQKQTINWSSMVIRGWCIPTLSKLSATKAGLFSITLYHIARVLIPLGTWEKSRGANTYNLHGRLPMNPQIVNCQRLYTQSRIGSNIDLNKSSKFKIQNTN